MRFEHLNLHMQMINHCTCLLVNILTCLQKCTNISAASWRKSISSIFLLFCLRRYPLFIIAFKIEIELRVSQSHPGDRCILFVSREIWLSNCFDMRQIHLIPPSWLPSLWQCCSWVAVLSSIINYSLLKTIYLIKNLDERFSFK